MKDEDKVYIIKKIPLGKLIDALEDLYERGVDFIDVIGVNDGEADKMGIAFNKDYMMKNDKEKEEEDVEEIKEANIKLSDEDLNQLL